MDWYDRIMDQFDEAIMKEKNSSRLKNPANSRPSCLDLLRMVTEMADEAKAMKKNFNFCQENSPKAP